MVQSGLEELRTPAFSSRTFINTEEADPAGAVVESEWYYEAFALIGLGF
jgi:hypothetical protein